VQRHQNPQEVQLLAGSGTNPQQMHASPFLTHVMFLE
jgi:hypothetical protein